jgi:ribulose-5-phosphate 4-epimerase/fuculose-1-phosphate aldolase
MAVSSVEGGLRPTNFYACNFTGQIAYHDFEGITVRDEEGARLIEHLGDKRVMLLRNHGLLAMGKTLPEAFLKLWLLQRACEVQVATAAMGTPIEVPPEVVAVHQRDLHMVQIPGGVGKADFDAMVRRVDKIDTSWRN